MAECHTGLTPPMPIPRYRVRTQAMFVESSILLELGISNRKRPPLSRWEIVRDLSSSSTGPPAYPDLDKGLFEYDWTPSSNRRCNPELLPSESDLWFDSCPHGVQTPPSVTSVLGINSTLNSIPAKKIKGRSARSRSDAVQIVEDAVGDEVVGR